MPASARSGRPRVSSRATIAEAAGELFLEQGYDATSVADITQRAGVGRSSFFNYFASKADVLWSGLDERIADVEQLLSDPLIAPRDALAEVPDGFAPDALALAITHAITMGVTADLERERAQRQARLQKAVAARLCRDGSDAVTADVRGAAYAAAVLAAVWRWADRAAPGERLDVVLARALDVADVPR